MSSSFQGPIGPIGPVEPEPHACQMTITHDALPDIGPMQCECDSSKQSTDIGYGFTMNIASFDGEARDPAHKPKCGSLISSAKYAASQAEELREQLAGAASMAAGTACAASEQAASMMPKLCDGVEDMLKGSKLWEQQGDAFKLYCGMGADAAQAASALCKKM